MSGILRRSKASFLFIMYCWSGKLASAWAQGMRETSSTRRPGHSRRGICACLCVLGISGQRLAAAGWDKSHDSQQTISFISLSLWLWSNASEEVMGKCGHVSSSPTCCLCHNWRQCVLTYPLSSDGTCGSAPKGLILWPGTWSSSGGPVRIRAGHLGCAIDLLGHRRL